MNEPSASLKELSIVVPVWNEAGSIARVLSELANHREAFARMEVVVVNDGSFDGTGRIVRQFAREDPFVTVVENSSQLGYGAALSRGFEVADTQFVGFMDGDGQIDPADVPRVCEAFERGVAAVVGLRVSRADSRRRRLLGRLGSSFARRFIGVEVADVNAGLKVFDTSLCSVLNLRSRGGFVSTELLERAASSGDVVQMPIRHFPREFGESTGSSIEVLAGLVADFVRQRS